MTNRFGIHLPDGEGPIFEEMRAVASSTADTLFVPGQSLADKSILDTTGRAWTIDAIDLRQWFGPLYFLRVTARYASATAITVPANGDIPNSGNSVIGVLAAEYRPAFSAPLHSYYVGPLASGGLSSSTGELLLGAVTPGTVISNAAPFTVDLGGLMLCPQMPW